MISIVVVMAGLLALCALANWTHDKLSSSEDHPKPTKPGADDPASQKDQ